MVEGGGLTDQSRYPPFQQIHAEDATVGGSGGLPAALNFQRWYASPPMRIQASPFLLGSIGLSPDSLGQGNPCLRCLDRKKRW